MFFFLSVSFFLRAAPKGKPTAFLKFIKFSVSFPSGWFPEAYTRQEGITVPPREKIHQESFRRLHVATVAFFINLSGDAEHFYKWQLVSFWKALTPTCRWVVNSQWRSDEHREKGGQDVGTSGFAKYAPTKFKVKVLIPQSCPTLCDPMDCSPPGSSVHEILQARILEGVAFPFSRESSQPKDQPWGLLLCRQILDLLSHQGGPLLSLGQRLVSTNVDYRVKDAVTTGWIQTESAR